MQIWYGHKCSKSIFYFPPSQGDHQPLEHHPASEAKKYIKRVRAPILVLSRQSSYLICDIRHYLLRVISEAYPSWDMSLDTEIRILEYDDQVCQVWLSTKFGLWNEGIGDTLKFKKTAETE